MKNKIFITFLVSSLFLILSCNEKSSQVGGHLPIHNPLAPTVGGTTGQTPAQPVYVYGEHFRVDNSSSYATMLRACGRCGTKKILPGGGFQLNLSFPNYNKCSHWDSEGYIQIEFVAKTLPTPATVTLWSVNTTTSAYLANNYYYHYNSNTKKNYGLAFSVKAEAKPINESEGFRIVLHPSLGLVGVHSLTIQSTSSNHVTDSTLHEVEFLHGGRERQTLFTQSLLKLTKRAGPTFSVPCGTYTW